EHLRMKTVIVLGMHGTPPSDFPRDEMAEFFGGGSAHDHGDHDEHDHSAHPGPESHAHNGHATHHGGPEQDEIRRQQRRKRKAELAAKMRAWPRTPANDP